MTDGKPQRVIVNSSRRPAKVLFVDENPDVQLLFREKIKKQFPIELTVADSPEGAAESVKNLPFDVVIYGHSNWEEGVQLYIDVLNNQKPVPQFIMFMTDPSALIKEFEGYFATIRKLDFDELFEAINWFVYQSGESD
jgi:hypothetical protein